MIERIYLDSAPLMYAVEGVPTHADLVIASLSKPEIVQVVSDLTRLECRVNPLRDGDAALLQEYDDYFENAVAQVVS